MRVHHNILEACSECLEKVFTEQQPAHMAFSQMIETRKKWGARDRKQAGDLFFGVIRHLRRYAFAVGFEGEQQLLPFPLLCAAWVLEQTEALPDWPKEVSLSAETMRARLEEAKQHFAIYSSVPDWLDEFGRNDVGENWEALINAQQEEAGVYIRVNLSRYRVDKLQQLLQVQGIETQPVEGYPAALQVMKRARLHTLDLFRQGAFEFQDPGSQAIVPFLEAKVGMTVVDTCAGAGGKSLHLADILQNRGRIISTDIEANKLAELNKRAEKSRFSIIETYTLNKDSNEKLPNYNADRVLIDAPCSGTGVLKRNPDTLWKLSPESLQNLLETQASLLQRYANAVSAGGYLVYATCSILPSENENQVKTFLASNTSFKLDKEQFLSPADTGFDGFYMARLSRAEL